MQDLKQREDKIKERRKHTPWREFVRDICSWQRVTFYKNNGFVSKYPISDRTWPIVEWWANFDERRENFIENWLLYNFSLSFFDNCKNLSKITPYACIVSHGLSENSEYSEWTYKSKNAYISSVVYDGENILYSYSVKGNSSDVINSIWIWNNSENIYFSVWVINSTDIFYSKNINNSNEIRFSTNMIWCSECILCNDLINQSYCIQNKQYTKEEYNKMKTEILRKKDMFMLYYKKCLVSKQNLVFSTNCEDVQHTMFVNQLKNSNNCLFIWGTWSIQESVYDTIGSANASDLYGNSGSWTWDNLYCNVDSGGGSHLFYCLHCSFCSFCLGCIWLKNKSFCILNKQYTKEERFEKANEIFAQMDKEGTLWKFFPPSMNPFYFNDTAAYLIDDTFTKEEVTAQWYLRREEEIKVDVPAWAEVITTNQLNEYQWFNANGQREINPEILKKVIKDEKWNYYRIVPMELEFLQKYGLPLPEIHWLDRIKLWFKFK